MNARTLVATTTAGIFMGIALQALACGEGQFNMGQGLQYQSYLAPRPASVLVYAESKGGDHQAIIAGLKQAGHRITEVSDDASLAQALHEQRYDVVIADYGDMDKITADAASAASAPRLLPVVERSQRNAPELRSRYNLFLLDGASLGQYLKVINQALSVNAQ